MEVETVLKIWLEMKMSRTALIQELELEGYVSTTNFNTHIPSDIRLNPQPIISFCELLT